MTPDFTHATVKLRDGTIIRATQVHRDGQWIEVLGKVGTQPEKRWLFGAGQVVKVRAEVTA